jgi:hypothetical protein
MNIEHDTPSLPSSLIEDDSVILPSESVQTDERTCFRSGLLLAITIGVIPLVVDLLTQADNCELVNNFWRYFFEAISSPR